MRTAFIEKISEMARKNEDIYFLTGDLGFSVIENFKKEFPQRFLNVGIAEQTMMGVAAGLALSGKTVFTYSIASFVTMRCFEQIRNDICYPNLKVRIIGIGSGFSYSTYGLTHNSLSDISLMRTLPNMTIIAPGDPTEVERAMEDSEKIEGPIYFRLGKKGEPRLYSEDINFEIGKGTVLRNGNKVALMSTGNMLETVCAVADDLEKAGISTKLISMHTVKPVDKELIMDTFNKVDYIFTIEEHHLLGGLGSAVAELISENLLNRKTVFKQMGVDDVFCREIGDQNYMRGLFGLSREQIFSEIMRTIKNGS